jgi:hypothetical protein
VGGWLWFCHSLAHSLAHSHCHCEGCGWSLSLSLLVSVHAGSDCASGAVALHERERCMSAASYPLHCTSGVDTHSLTHSLTLSLSHSLTHSLTHSVSGGQQQTEVVIVATLSLSLTHSLAHSLAIVLCALSAPQRHDSDWK